MGDFNDNAKERGSLFSNAYREHSALIRLEAYVSALLAFAFRI